MTAQQVTVPRTKTDALWNATHCKVNWYTHRDPGVFHNRQDSGVRLFPVAETPANGGLFVRRFLFSRSECFFGGVMSENHSVESAPHVEKQASQWKLNGELLFEIFCAAIFLGMIGLVFFNAFLRYFFSSSFPPSEEWARFLFIYITFFGAIEAFYRNKHIAVDMFVNLLEGTTRKTVDVIASALTLFALGLLVVGGVQLVLQTMDTFSVSTNVNMAFINGTLLIMALAAFIIRARDFVALLARPADTFVTVKEL